MSVQENKEIPEPTSGDSLPEQNSTEPLPAVETVTAALTLALDNIYVAKEGAQSTANILITEPVVTEPEKIPDPASLLAETVVAANEVVQQQVLEQVMETVVAANEVVQQVAEQVTETMVAANEVVQQVAEQVTETVVAVNEVVQQQVAEQVTETMVAANEVVQQQVAEQVTETMVAANEVVQQVAEQVTETVVAVNEVVQQQVAEQVVETVVAANELVQEKVAEEVSVVIKEVTKNAEQVLDNIKGVIDGSVTKSLAGLLVAAINPEGGGRDLKMVISKDASNIISTVAASRPAILDDIKKSLVEVTRDNKVNSTDIPQFIAMFQSLHDFVCSLKEFKPDIQSKAEICATVFKIITHFLILDDQICADNADKTLLLTQLDDLIDSGVDLLAHVPTIKLKGCFFSFLCK
jgi:hypothetical protein